MSPRWFDQYRQSSIRWWMGKSSACTLLLLGPCFGCRAICPTLLSGTQPYVVLSDAFKGYPCAFTA